MIALSETVPEGLETLRGKVIRYWIEENKDGQCDYGVLLSWDQIGFLIEDREARSKEFIPWSRMRYSLQYLEDDQDYFDE